MVLLIDSILGFKACLKATTGVSDAHLNQGCKFCVIEQCHQNPVSMYGYDVLKMALGD